MYEHKTDLAQWLQQQERERLLRNPRVPLPPREPPTIHWTELPEANPGSGIAAEWNLYRQQVGRLLQEGHEGRWILIKGEEIIGIWETEEEADEVRLQRFPMQDVLLRQILERERVLRGPMVFRVWGS